MGMSPIAVYSDADAHALHVRMADLALPIGAAPASESYLRIDRIIDAAKASGAEAIHPGYGFLAENADFAAAVEEAAECGQGALEGVDPAAGTDHRDLHRREVVTAHEHLRPRDPDGHSVSRVS